MDAVRPVAIAILLACTGCAHTATPNWTNPGPATYQRSNALRFDPYPENDAGPAIVGARPPDYQNPPAEAGRARWDPRRWFGAR